MELPGTRVRVVQRYGYQVHVPVPLAWFGWELGPFGWELRPVVGNGTGRDLETINKD